MNRNGTMLQAQQYAAAEGDIVRYTAYDDLSAQTRTKITDTDFFKEISVGTESSYTDTIKQKIVTVKIYKGSDLLPCYKLEVPRLSADVKGKGVPIGTVITWASDKTPVENGVWLECNGQSCAAYPELTRLLGKSNVPDYRGRFLEGNTVPGIVKEAGLPNIVGESYRDAHEAENPDKLDSKWQLSQDQGFSFSGAFKRTIGRGRVYSSLNATDDLWAVPAGFTFDASRSSSIYGNSDTVQPPAVTVRYFIRAA